MGIIEVPCANIQCDSTDIEYLRYITLTQEVRHDYTCNVCDTTFSIYTRLGRVKIPQETS